MHVCIKTKERQNRVGGSGKGTGWAGGDSRQGSGFLSQGSCNKGPQTALGVGGGGLAATAIDSLTAPEGRSPKSRCPPARAPSKALGEALSRLFRLLAVPGVPRHVAASLHVYLCLQAALLHRVSVCFKFPFRLLIPTPVIGLGPTLNPG